MTRVQVVIAYGGSDPVRARTLEWVRQRYERHHDLPTIVATNPHPEWSKGDAVNIEIGASRADIIVCADADSFVADEHLQYAIGQAERVGWAMPHSVVKRLTRTASLDVMRGEAMPRRRRLERAGYPALPGGGIVVATRDAWRTVRGFDPRFRGWGGEDHAIGLAMRTLVAPLARARLAPLWHLWHPPAPRCRQPSDDTRALDKRYRAARDDPAAMRALIGEW